MEKLQILPNVTRLSERVLRILGQNPGKFTLQGTNTYIIGKHAPYILIDTGEGRASYPEILESALRDLDTSTHKSLSNEEAKASGASPIVSDIIITHRHHDHFGGLSDVLALVQKLWRERYNADTKYNAPRLHKFPLPSDNPDTTLDDFLLSLPDGTFVRTPEGSTLFPLKEHQNLSSPGTTLEVLHTPGHTKDSVMLLLKEEKALFTADSVLGQGTAVFEDLSEYIASLNKVLRKRAEGGSWVFDHVYPGHGPIVEDGPALISTYIKHRLEREEQVMKVLSSPNGESQIWSVWDIVSKIYKDYPESLWAPAAHGVTLHLKKLQADRRARLVEGASEEGPRSELWQAL